MVYIQLEHGPGKVLQYFSWRGVAVYESRQCDRPTEKLPLYWFQV